MTGQELNELYFSWMCDMVNHSKKSYEKLFRYLHDYEFNYIIGMDANRVEDGIDLRYRFAYECDILDTLIAVYLDERPCSVFEMMVALALRCEEHIMDDPDVGNQMDRWFWDMLDSLGLSWMDDAKFDEKFADGVMERLIMRQYEKNGKGGLFTIRNCPHDLREVEIWYQMMWYLDEILKE